MLGTFAKVLAENRIPTPAEYFRATVAGDIEAVKGILKIVRIAVTYHLALKPTQREDAQACLDSYLERCPAAQSVVGCIDIAHSLNVIDR